VRVLVTGGAGYIGSVVTAQLVDEGHDVTVVDNLLYGHREAVHEGARFAQGDILDAEWLGGLVAGEGPDAVVHLAAEASVHESIGDPGKFYRANVCGGVNLLEAMEATGCQRIVFSSTAAVYGEPEAVPIKEDSPLRPCNSYGDSKLAFERVLGWYRRAYGLRHISLRYFNAAGATEGLGEHRAAESHIIPLLLDVAAGHREQFSLFGTDYDTPDGTCVRDYIHVSDIAKAHVLALLNIDRIEARAYNMGNGSGYTNRQVVDVVRAVTGRAITVTDAERRPGDPAQLVASSARIRAELGWGPEFPDLTTIVETAWRWKCAHPRGYSS